MKGCPSASTRWRKLVRAGSLASLFFAAYCLSASQLSQPRVTQVVRDVKLVRAEAAAHSAALSEMVADGATLRTGAGSRAELTFADQTTVRLGANTALRLDATTDTMNLDEGATLFQIPTGAPSAKIKSGAISVESKGATGILERHRNFYIKCLLLEGDARAYLENQIGESLLMHSGQILITKPDATSLPDPAYFDIARVMKTCLLVREFRPLPRLHSIELEEQKQADLIRTGTYIPSNLVIFGRGTLVNLVNPAPPGKSGASSTAQSTPGR